MSEFADIAELQARYVDFIRSDSGDVAVGKLLSGVDRLLASVNEILSYEPEQLIRSRRLSFGSREAVTYPQDLETVERGLRSKTVVLQALELSNDELGLFCREVSDEIQSPVGASSYLSTQEVDAFDWHVDDWQSAIVHLDGRKVFEFRNHEEIELTPGDVIFFRRNIEHRTRTIGHSIHLSITVRN